MFYRLFLIALSWALFSVPSIASAESNALVSNVLVKSNVQADVFTALQELQNSVLGSLVWSTPIGGGACKPKLSLGFFNLQLTYDKSDTCPLMGTVTVRLFPLQADVDLDVNNLPTVTRLQMKAKLSVQYRLGSGLNLGFAYLDGRISLRPDPSFPTMDMVMNGSVVMGVTSSNFSVQGRNNIFLASSGAGFSLITQLSKQPVTRRFEGCTLTGGNPNDVNAGTLAACKTLFK